MNYKRIYDRLICNAYGRIRNEYDYMEQHHIKPRCMNGSDDDANLVWLTAREHFVAHQLLVKLHPNQPGLAEAARWMCFWADHQRERSKNRTYGWLKNRMAKARSVAMKGKSWDELYGVEKSALMRERCSIAKRGKTQSAEHRKKNSDFQKSNPTNLIGKPVVIDGLRYQTRVEAARQLGVNKTTIQRWIANGKAISA